MLSLRWARTQRKALIRVVASKSKKVYGVLSSVSERVPFYVYVVTSSMYGMVLLLVQYLLTTI